MIQNNGVVNISDTESVSLKLISSSHINSITHKVINDVKNNGRTLSEVAKTYGISKKSVYQLLKTSELQANHRTTSLIAEIQQLESRIQSLTNELISVNS